MSFQSQLQSTRENLERLGQLAAAHPDLFEHADLQGANSEAAQIYIHAWVGDEAKAVDWLALATKYKQAKWTRQQSASYANRMDWNGRIENVDICILAAEGREELQPLFAEASAA